MRETYGDRGCKAEELFNSRSTAYKSLFFITRSKLRSHVLDNYGDIAAASVSTVRLNEGKLLQAVDRYINDLKRLKEMHIAVNCEFEETEKKLHRSKIAAYSIKWLLVEHPVHSTVEFADYNALPNEVKGFLDDINMIYVLEVLFYHLNFLDDERDSFCRGGKYARLYYDLMYYIKTAAYSEKMASLLFDALYVNSNEYKRGQIKGGSSQ